MVGVVKVSAQVGESGEVVALVRGRGGQRHAQPPRAGGGHHLYSAGGEGGACPGDSAVFQPVRSPGAWNAIKDAQRGQTKRQGGRKVHASPRLTIRSKRLTTA